MTSLRGLGRLDLSGKSYQLRFIRRINGGQTQILGSNEVTIRLMSHGAINGFMNDIFSVSLHLRTFLARNKSGIVWL